MSSETFWGIAGLVILVGFVVFAFRQGMRVRRPAEGAPPEVTPPAGGPPP